MNLYDLLAADCPDAEGSHIWDALYSVSNYVESMRDFDESLTHEMFLKIHKETQGPHFNQYLAEHVLKDLSKGDIGEDRAYERIKEKLPDHVTRHDFIVAFQYLASLYRELLYKWFGTDVYEYLIDLTVAFLCNSKEGTLFKILA